MAMEDQVGQQRLGLSAVGLDNGWSSWRMSSVPRKYNCKVSTVFSPKPLDSQRNLCYTMEEQIPPRGIKTYGTFKCQY